MCACGACLKDVLLDPEYAHEREQQHLRAQTPPCNIVEQTVTNLDCQMLRDRMLRFFWRQLCFNRNSFDVVEATLVGRDCNRH